MLVWSDHTLYMCRIFFLWGCSTHNTTLSLYSLVLNCLTNSEQFYQIMYINRIHFYIEELRFTDHRVAKSLLGNLIIVDNMNSTCFCKNDFHHPLIVICIHNLLHELWGLYDIGAIQRMQKSHEIRFKKNMGVISCSSVESYW